MVFLHDLQKLSLPFLPLLLSMMFSVKAIIFAWNCVKQLFRIELRSANFSCIHLHKAKKCCWHLHCAKKMGCKLRCANFFSPTALPRVQGSAVGEKISAHCIYWRTKFNWWESILTLWCWEKTQSKEKILGEFYLDSRYAEAYFQDLRFVGELTPKMVYNVNNVLGLDPNL